MRCQQGRQHCHAVSAVINRVGAADGASAQTFLDKVHIRELSRNHTGVTLVRVQTVHGIVALITPGVGIAVKQYIFHFYALLCLYHSMKLRE